MSRSSQAAARHFLVASHHPLCLTSSSLFLFCGWPGSIQPAWNGYCLNYEKLLEAKKKGTVVCAVQMVYDCIRIWHEPGRLGNHTHSSAFKGLQKIPFTVCKALDVTYHTPRYCEITTGDSGSWSPGLQALGHL